MEYVVHALLSVTGDKTSEISMECENWDRVFEAIKILDNSDETWMAISIVHIEDHPKLLQGAFDVTDG